MSVFRNGTRLRPESIEFSFDGRRFTGQVGDTAASALLAAGVRFYARSGKYRRLRGVVTSSPEEPNALLTVGESPTNIPNIPATVVRIRPGMVLRSQNRWPSLRADLSALLKFGGGLFGAGFYYKTFIRPSWRFWEGLIRRLAGMGNAPQACELPSPALEHTHCDVLVAGGGSAGLMAALMAARAGASVVVAEREPIVGGELEFEAARIDGHSATRWIESALDELDRRGARVLTDTALVGGSAGECVLHSEPSGMPGAARITKIRPKALVLATGAMERPIAFIDNDKPGVMLLGAAERFLAGFGVRVAMAVVVFGNHDRIYPAAQRLASGGIQIAAIIDTRAAGAAGAGVALVIGVPGAGFSAAFSFASRSVICACNAEMRTCAATLPASAWTHWKCSWPIWSWKARL